jgi:PhnB protein
MEKSKIEHSKSDIKNIPEGYNQVMPYLIVDGAAAFIKFMQTVFGATEKLKEMRDERLIMHAEITIGESVIMLADATEAYKPMGGSFFIYVANCNAVYKKAMDAGATSLGEPAQQSYGLSAGIKDNFGNTWWITG